MRNIKLTTDKNKEKIKQPESIANKTNSSNNKKEMVRIKSSSESTPDKPTTSKVKLIIINRSFKFKFKINSIFYNVCLRNIFSIL